MCFRAMRIICLRLTIDSIFLLLFNAGVGKIVLYLLDILEVVQ